MQNKEQKKPKNQWNSPYDKDEQSLHQNYQTDPQRQTPMTNAEIPYKNYKPRKPKKQQEMSKKPINEIQQKAFI